MDDLQVRPAGIDDVARVASMCHLLWPDGSVQEHADELLALLTRAGPGNLPSTFLVAEQHSGEIVGFVQVGIRSHADGCDPSQPAGYVEGWYVEPAFRRRRIGAQLIAAAEAWAKRQGCVEMASDALIDNRESQLAHEALGYEVVDRCVRFRKGL